MVDELATAAETAVTQNTGINANEILNNIISITTNDVILFVIVLVVACVLVVVPGLYVYNKMRRDNQKAAQEERKMITDVINRNTEAFVELKSTLSENSATQQALLKNININTSDTRERAITFTTQHETMVAKLNELLKIGHETYEEMLRIHSTEDDSNKK